MNDRHFKGRTIAAILELILAAGFVLFWISFFFADVVQISDPHLEEVYLAFESAFPVADACLSAVLVIGGVGLLRKKSTGRFFTLIGGSSLVFLGLLDITFNIRHGIYLLGWSEAALNVFINLVCLGAGVFLILMIWKSRLN